MQSNVCDVSKIDSIDNSIDDPFTDSFALLHSDIICLEQYSNIGPAKIKALKKAGLDTLWKLLTHFPKITQIDDLLKCTIFDIKHIYKPKPYTILKVALHDGRFAKVHFFSLQRHLKIKQTIFVSESSKCQNSTSSNLRFLHPKIFLFSTNQLVEYNQKPPLFDKTMQYVVFKALDYIKQIPVFSKDLALVVQAQTWHELLLKAHTNPNLSLKVFKQLEFAAYQHLMKTKKYKGYVMNVLAPELMQVYQQLPLTECQQRVVKQIQSDFSTGIASKRIIFGDVGTGKTFVALIAAMYALSAGKNVIILAPLTLLAKQIFNVFKTHLHSVNIQLLTQKTKIEYKTELKSPGIIIGTHALFYQPPLDCGLVIIDEQHRFGVKQRGILLKRDNQQAYHPHLLTLTATPIPRSLSLVLNNYVQVSQLHTKPKPVEIETYVLSDVDYLISKLKKDKDSLIYWVCPLIGDENFADNQGDLSVFDKIRTVDTKIKLANITERFESLKDKFDVGILHGRIKDQEHIYQQALNKKFHILLATTVIEVGIDIPHADLIIIEDAHRFGLAQLHQLRGRVGRNGKKGRCILLYSNNIGIDGKKRLNLMKTIDNGFELAAKDLELRGAGKIFGHEQIGFEQFSFLKLEDFSKYTSEFGIPKLDQKTLESLSNIFFDASETDGA